MKRNFGVVATVLLAGGATLGVAGPASASQPYDPNVARIANPANACKSIPGSIEHASELLGIPVDTSSFDYAGCVRTLAQGKAVVEPVEEFGDPYAQCDMLVEVGAFTYPTTLHNGTDFEDMLLPDLTIKNRRQCGSALYAFHAIFSSFGG